jgi:thiol-disulfide isomerase/thioredoxin
MRFFRPKESIAWVLAAIVVAGCGAEKLAEREAPVPDVVESEPQAEYTPPPVDLKTAAEIRALVDAAKGNLVVINFWATWCPPCVKEMPELARFYRAYDGEGIEFLSISADHHSTKDSKVVPFVKSYEIPFPVHVMYLEDPDALLKELPIDWDGALPATFIFDESGEVEKSWVGEVTFEILREAIAEIQGGDGSESD